MMASYMASSRADSLHGNPANALMCCNSCSRNRPIVTNYLRKRLELTGFLPRNRKYLFMFQADTDEVRNEDEPGNDPRNLQGRCRADCKKPTIRSGSAL